jgi:hypothetical protein
VPTKRFNEAFKRARDRFPTEFAFQLTAGESVAINWSQTATSSCQVADNQHRISSPSPSIMGSSKHRSAIYRPWAFTEHGALMAANILRSARAREMSVFIIRAFLRMREELASNAAILKRLAEIDSSLLVHDSALRDLYHKRLPLLAPPAEPSKARIGFHPGNR